MSFLLDTDICSFHLRGDRRLFGRFAQYLGHLHISIITVAELSVWTQRRSAPASRQAAVKTLLQDATILGLDMSVAEKYGELRAAQLDVGALTPQIDLLIASTALIHGLTLVTHNVADFVSMPGLHVVDWLTP